jgi:LuxR family transcriptional regulator, maltose regulon positive regulatory protein
VLNREDRAALDRWLNLLPEDFIVRHPWPLMIKTFAFQFSWRLSTVWKLLDQIEALLQNEAESPAGDTYERTVLRGLIATLRGQGLFFQCQPESAIASLEEALALLPEEWRHTRGAVRWHWGLSLRAVGNGDIAQRSLRDDFESLSVRNDAYASRLPFAMACNFLEMGRLDEAGQMGQVMLDLSASGRFLILMGWAHYVLGTVHYCWNDLEVAEKHFEQGFDMRYSIHAQAARCCMIGLAQVLMAKGETREASVIVEQLRQLDVERTGVEGDDARSLRAQLEYLQGDTESAFSWADGYSSPVPDRLLNWSVDPHLVKASLLVTRGAGADLDAGLSILGALNEIAEHRHCARLQLAVLAVRAVALEKQGRTLPALAALEQAVELARLSGSVKLFVDLGTVMQTLLRRLAGRGFALETVRRILAAFPKSTSKADAPADFRFRIGNAELLEPLTQRELDVLVLLRERMSNKEIAGHLDLSVSTVKRHACNIYSKLDVVGRRDAVMKAEQLRVLASS